jgi:hypothetical protein
MINLDMAFTDRWAESDWQFAQAQPFDLGENVNFLGSGRIVTSFLIGSGPGGEMESESRSKLMVPLLCLTALSTGCVVVGGYSSERGWFLWPGSILIIVVVAVLFLLLRRRR